MVHFSNKCPVRLKMRRLESMYRLSSDSWHVMNSVQYVEESASSWRCDWLLSRSCCCSFLQLRTWMDGDVLTCTAARLILFRRIGTKSIAISRESCCCCSDLIAVEWTAGTVPPNIAWSPRGHPGLKWRERRASDASIDLDQTLDERGGLHVSSKHF